MSTYDLSPDELSELLSGFTPEIPGCRVLRMIGRGGMSFVYLGVQESLARQVAIKVIAPLSLKDEVSMARFEKEARTIAKLQHPCIVQVFAVGRSEQGLLYYLLPYLPKGHLGQRDLTHNDAGVIEVMRALLWALDYAHANGVVHRDVKGENVLFDNADRPLLADFGIAASNRDRARVTSEGLAVGSTAHMAPEQARAEQVDGRADLYSLGVLTFEKVTGHLPFQNSDDLGLALMHAMDPVPRLPPEKQHWQAFIDTAMAKRPDDRFQNAREMMAALERVVDQAKPDAEENVRTQAHPSGATSARSRFRPRNVAIALSGIAVLATVLAIGWLRPFSLALVTEAPKVTAAPSPDAIDRASSPLSTVAISSPSETDSALLLPDPMPLAPGEREVAAAQDQIARRRLTQPSGDNAYDSLRAAHQADPGVAQLSRVGQRWLSAATPFISAGVEAGTDESAAALFTRARTLADELVLRESAAWIDLEAAVVAATASRLRGALASGDLEALRRIKANATQWGLASARFEPFWSQSIVRAKPGDALRLGETSMVLARLATSNRPGLAVLPHAVTRQEYAAFVAATGHASARCRIRTAMMTLKRRTWDRPGFEQQGSHPVVCVSAADAAAYANWLGQRDGQQYRLPRAEEWRALGLDGATPACRGRCEGTVPITATAKLASGVRVHTGSAREWSADCREGCSQRLSLGSSWRDTSVGADARAADAVKSGDGYDDIGFRLMRDVSAAELEQR